MKTTIAIFLTSFVYVFLVSCGPSQEELDATATQELANLHAQQTADAPTSTPTATLTPEPTSTPTPVRLSAAEILAPAIAALEGADTYHMEMALQSEVDVSGLTMEMTMRFDGDIANKINLRGLYDMTLAGEQLHFEMIQLGNESYIREPGAEEWLVVPAEEVPVSADTFPSFNVKNFSNLSFVGEEILDGEPVYRIQGVTDNIGHLMGALSISDLGQLGEGVGISGVLTAEYWIAIESGMIKRARTYGDLVMSGDLSSLGASELIMNMDMSVAYSDFGKEVTIEAPQVIQTPMASEINVEVCLSEEVLCVGLVPLIGGLYDYNYNQSTWEGIVAAGRQLDATVDYLEPTVLEEYEANIRRFAEAGYDIIVTVGFQQAEATIEMANEFPQVHFIGVDQDNNVELDNLTALEFQEYNGGFLAGALAGLITENDHVAGVFGSELVAPVVDFQEGFSAGASYVNPGLQVSISYHPGDLGDTFNDPEWGAETTRRAIENGADVVFAAAGTTGSGALVEAAETNVYCIGVDSDQWFTVLQAQSCLVSSAIKDISAGVEEMVVLAANDQLDGGTYFGPMVLSPYHDFRDQLPQQIKDTLQQLADSMVNIERFNPD